MKNLHKISIRKFKGNRSYEGPMSIWEDNIKVDLKDTEWGLNSCNSG
jgi:hypothetical protein